MRHHHEFWGIASAALIVAAVAIGGARAAGPGKSPSAPGSAEFKPTPARPAGWRGDWTGRFPAATPVLEWGRAPKSVEGLTCQAAKPKGDASSGGAPIRLGIMPDWLVLGYFDPAAADQSAGQALVANESRLQPESGQKTGGLTWKPLHVSSFALDPADVLGKLEKDQTRYYYAHTWLHSPAPAKLRLMLGHGAGLKAWLNGKEVYSQAKAVDATWDGGQKVAIQLEKGWNRLLLRGSAIRVLIAPAVPVQYVSRNILWATPMPRPSVAQPVIVGDRLFVCSEPSDLLCIDKNTGKILWLRPHNYSIALAGEKRQSSAYKENVQPLADKLAEANAGILADLNAGRTIDPKWNKQKEIELKIYDELRSVDRSRSPRRPGQYEWASPTPCTDGKFVYACFTNGIAACYDPQGKLQWANKVEPVGGAEHGQHFSPVLLDGRFIVALGGAVTALDAATGKIAWHTEAAGWLTPTRIGAAGVVIASVGKVLRVADGKIIADLRLQNGYGWTTPIVEKGVLYDYLSRGDRSGGSFTAVLLPQTAVENGKGGPARRIEFGEKGLQEGWFDSSLLYHEGLVYAVNATGELIVMDFQTGRIVYRQPLDMHPFVQYVVMPGVTASPTLAGGHIFLMDNQGTTVVIEPGRRFKEIARNTIENNTYSAMGAWGKALGQEQTLSTPVFEGGRMYMRAQEVLYCIGEK